MPSLTTTSSEVAENSTSTVNISENEAMKQDLIENEENQNEEKSEPNQDKQQITVQTSSEAYHYCSCISFLVALFSL